MVSILQKFDAAIMVAMSMADDDVLDIGRIETHFLQAIHYFVLCGVTVKSIDENDPCGSLHCPCAIDSCGQHVEVVKNLASIGIPSIPGRRGPGTPPSGSTAGCHWGTGRL